MSDSAIRQQVKEMAHLTILSNRISEIQEKNLKSYPFVFFNDVNSVKIDYDLRDKQNVTEEPITHSVTYRLELNEETNKEHLEKRFLCLEEAVKTLFWKDLSVEVFFNNKQVYKSKNVGQ